MPPKLAEPRTRRWTLPEYYRAGEEGYFENRRVELIRGEIVEMAPQGHLHFLTLHYAGIAMNRLFAAGYWVRVQGPVNVAIDSAPEPDIAVVRGNIEQHTDHPKTAILVIEVSDSTISFDRKNKASLYAAAGIPEYWILDARRRQLEVSRQPTRDDSAETGFRYSEMRVLGESELIAPLALPDQPLAVSQFFPPAP